MPIDPDIQREAWERCKESCPRCRNSGPPDGDENGTPTHGRHPCYADYKDYILLTYPEDSCDHDVIPREDDPRMGRCTKCGDGSFPIAYDDDYDEDVGLRGALLLLESRLKKLEAHATGLVGAIVVHLTMGDNEDEVRACVDAITTLMSDGDDAEDSEDLQN